LIYKAPSDQLLHEISVDLIKCWRQERTSYDTRTQLVTKLKGQAYNCYQLYIDVGKISPIRILSMERWKIRHVLKIISDELTTIPKEEFWCQLLTKEASIRNVMMRFLSSQIELRDANSGDTVLDIPLKCLVGWEVKPIPDNMKSKFEQGIEDSIILDLGSFGPSLLLGTDEISHIVIEIKKNTF